ncbi:MAG: penicillin-binding protein 2 [bacterium]|nr:penicillin-binding protein 2 [bacterium]
MKNFPFRLILIKTAVVAGALILMTKLYTVQIVRGDDFSERAARQYVQEGTSSFDRGNIYFKNKDGTLMGAAVLKQGFTLSINPSILSSPESTYEKLSEIVPIEKDSFMAKAGKKGDPHEEILKQIDKKTADKIRALQITGVFLTSAKWRYYPGNASGAHVLGFVGFQGNELTGRYGLESYYEGVLERTDEKLYVNFFAEVFSSIGRIVSGDSKRSGDVLTGIEPSVQAFLEENLLSISEKWESKLVGGIVIEPTTGQIVAMSTLPTFNPNDFRNADPSTFLNPFVSSVYELGSVIKPLTVAAGIDSGSITSNTKYFDAGFVTVNGLKISNYDGKGRGEVDIQTALSQSLNTGMAHVVLKMGRENFAKYMTSLELGEETGVDLPGEVRGLVKNLESPRNIEHVTASFGQGIALTPIAAVRALTSLANGGVLPNLHVASSIDYDLGFEKNLTFGEGKRVFKKETADEVTRMLVSGVDDTLSDGKYKMEHYSIAAKTGTAQIAKTDDRGYYDDRFLHSFFGYFPAYEPKFLIFLFTVEPKGVDFSSQTLAEPFMNTAKFLINYYEIPPDR